MAKRPLTQSEADGLLGVEKLAGTDGLFYPRVDTRFPKLKVQVATLYVGDSFPGAKVDVRVGHDFFFRAFSISLHAELPDRLSTDICRYDLHRGPHQNGTGCPDRALMPAMHAHAHLYRETSVRRGGNWDDCAELLDPDGDTFGLRVRSVTDLFVTKFKIRSETGDFFDTLFRVPP